MILKACDSHRQWIFTAIKLEQVNGKEELALDKGWKKYELIAKSKYYKWRRTTTKDDMVRQISAVSGVKVTFVDKNGEEYSPSNTRASTLEHDEDGNVRGSAYTGSFDRIVDPAQVEAIRVGGVWLELDTFTLAETPGS